MCGLVKCCVIKKRMYFNDENDMLKTFIDTFGVICPRFIFKEVRADYPLVPVLYLHYKLSN